MSVRILIGDCMERMAELPDGSVDSCVTDPPYHLSSIVKRFGAADAAPAKVGATGAYARASRGFMGQQWDGGDVAFRPKTWAEVLRVLKPGAHLVAFSGTRTYHRMACAIEDAGFEIRDQLAWCFGSGFPKSHDVSKGIDKAAGAEREFVGLRTRLGDKSSYPDEFTGFHGGGVGSTITTPATDAARQWQGWGTALKPAWEPICLARKPLVGTVAANVLAHGTGALNIDGCRVGAANGDYDHPGDLTKRPMARNTFAAATNGDEKVTQAPPPSLGRWPANLVHDGSVEVLAGFPETSSGAGNKNIRNRDDRNAFGKGLGAGYGDGIGGDSGSAARFFYTAKTDSAERHRGCEDLPKGNHHPTVKPVDLMRWLCRLVTPKGGTVLDPFAGSGSTLIAADAEQFHAIGCELSPEYAAIAERRVRAAAGMFAEIAA